MSKVDDLQKNRRVKVGLVQMRCVDDPAQNLAKACAQIEAAAKQGATIVCLPELFRSLYFCQSEENERFDLAEVLPGPTTDVLSQLASRLGVVILASLFERRAPGLYHNTTITFDADGALVGKYRKMHIPDDPLYYEKFYFTPGDLGFFATPTRYAKVGNLVCWDQWYPEAARLTALAGAEILFYPTAIGWQFSVGAEMDRAQQEAWETMQRAHAIANGVFVVVVNRVGEEGGIRFWGQSFVADPFGRVLARAASNREEVLVVECDLGLIEDTRQNWPFLRDRRIDAYGDLMKRFRDE